MRMKGSRALKKTKCGKSGGLDGISVKRLKREGKAMIKWIRRLFNARLNSGEVPESWRISCVVPIY